MERNQNLITKWSSLRRAEGTYGRLLPLVYSQSPSRPRGEPTRSPRSAALPAVLQQLRWRPASVGPHSGPAGRASPPLAGSAPALLSADRTSPASPILQFPELLILFSQHPLVTFLAADFAASPLSLQYTLRGNQIEFLDPLQYRAAPRAESFLASLWMATFGFKGPG